MQLRRWAATLVTGAALTTLVVPGTAQAATAMSLAPQAGSAVLSIGGVWRAIVDEDGFITDFWWWPY